MNSSLKKLLIALLAAGGLSLPLTADARGIIVTVEPPQPRVEVVPPAPYPGAVWSPGYYRWHHRRHVWVDGHYMRQRPGHSWHPHRWERDGRGWRMHRGGWHRD
jgi:hypothetical protein